MILVVDPDPSLRSRLAGELGRGSLLEAAGVENLQRAASNPGSNLTVVILGPNLDISSALGASDALELSARGISVLLIASQVTPDVLRAAMRSGVKDVLAASFSRSELVEAVSRAEGLARQTPPQTTSAGTASRPRRLVTVFSSKGGCGKSVVASNLAILLAQRTGGEVGLVDLDLGSGDLSIMLGLLPAWTIFDAAEQGDRLDAEALTGYLTPHPSKVMLLAAPLDPALAETVSPESVRRILNTLSEALQYVVVDAPCSFTDQILSALDQSDTCILVGSMDVPSIRNLKLSLSTLAALGFGRERIRVVLSRADSRVGLNLGEVEKTLGTKIDVAIPSSRDVPLSVNQGMPLAASGKKSSVVSAIASLVDGLLLPVDQPQSTRRGSKSRG